MKKVSLPFVIDFLNQINDLDRSVLPALIACRVPCNKELAAHPTVQVGMSSSIDCGLDNSQIDKYEVGFLGILNGIFGVKKDGWGYIAAHYKDKELKEIERFAILEPQPKPFTEGEFESLVDKASQPVEPEQKPDAKEAETSESPTYGDCNESHTHSDTSGDT